jgi:hypothetical protein
MYWFINSITDKPDWERKVFDDVVVARWRAEVDEFAAAGTLAAAPLDDEAPYGDPIAYPPIARGFSDDMFNYCMAELRDKARISEASRGFVSVFDGAGAVVKSDKAVSEEIKQGLRALAARLEDVPPEDRDWHPGSDDKVLDLVHPSLWPLVYGKTRYLDRTLGVEDALGAYASGNTVPVPEEPKGERLWSTRFQWLPAEVEVTRAGDARFVSYINNLHPSDTEGYTVLAKLFTAALPALEAVYRRVREFDALMNGAFGRDAPGQDAALVRSRIVATDSARICKTEFICEGSCYSSRCPADFPYKDGEGEPERNRRWFWENHPVGQPEPREYKFLGEEFRLTATQEKPWFPMVEKGWIDAQVAELHKIRKELRPKYVVPGEKPDASAKEEPASVPAADHLRNRQVIVKIANINLTSEKPTYDGGSWHIEGQINERICATALYYYDSENITESRLGFRSTCDAEGFSEGEFAYDQDDHIPFQELYGMRPGMYCDSTEVPLGDVVTREGRLVVFPNVFRHCVSPFELADKTRPGHRKIVALFLVDPAAPVVSTARVPPQQLDWGTIPVLNSLPPELAQVIMNDVACPFGMEEAKRLRAELIEERKAYDEVVEEGVREAQWCFCEH